MSGDSPAASSASSAQESSGMPEELEANSGEHSDSPPLVRFTDNSDDDDDDDDDADTANESTQKMCKQGATDDPVVSVTQTASAPLFCLLNHTVNV